MLGNFKLRRYEKDFNKIIDAVVEAYLNKKMRSHTFKTDRYKLLGTLLEKSTILPSPELVGVTGNEKIDKVLKLIESIKRGEYVDLKPYNLLPENPLVIQNEINRYKKGEIKAEAVLTNSTKHSDELCIAIYTDYVKKATLPNILKYKTFLTKEALHTILSRVNAEEFNISPTNEDLVQLLSVLKLTKQDYIDLSLTLSNGAMVPDQRMKLFEMLSEKNEDAMDAYLYTLFDLEMIESADDILNNSQPDEYLNFKAYRALKECGKNFSIDLFI